MHMKNVVIFLDDCIAEATKNTKDRPCKISKPRYAGASRQRRENLTHLQQVFAVKTARERKSARSAS
jgi:hypothetical protein